MNCPICKQQMFQTVKILIWCPASQDVFNKTTLRRKAVEIISVERPSAKEYSCYRHGTLGDIIGGIGE